MGAAVRDHRKTIADAVLDRLVHTAHRLTLDGETLAVRDGSESLSAINRNPCPQSPESATSPWNKQLFPSGEHSLPVGQEILLFGPQSTSVIARHLFPLPHF